MAKVVVNGKYGEALKNFIDVLAKCNPSVTCYSETGRKFDKVIVGTEVRYFVQRSTATIYGAKSPLAPNIRWWFDTLDNISKWKWEAKYGEPTELAGVRLIGQYGSYNHYEKIPPTEKKENA